jgi:AcrR family transcriptional regulator
MTLMTGAPSDADAVPGARAGDASRQAIVDAALELGERRGWDALHLYDVADALGVTLAAVERHFDHKDAVAEAWFDRADAALLAAGETPGWMALTPRQRVQRAIFAWLDALEPHRRLSAAMLAYKFQPEHLHLQAQGVIRISRTVQWIREVARLPAVSWRRELAEAALTSMYLATFARWLADDTPGAERARALLDRMLALAERAAPRLGF